MQVEFRSHFSEKKSASYGPGNTVIADVHTVLLTFHFKIILYIILFGNVPIFCVRFEVLTLLFTNTPSSWAVTSYQLVNSYLTCGRSWLLPSLDS